MRNCYCFDSPIGKLTVYGDDNVLTRLEFDAAESDTPTPLLYRAARQLEQYFAGERRFFELPLQPHGTDFQLKIWKCLQQIPYGETRSYKQLAEMADNPRACRAVGGANHWNPLPIFIPCHRVIGSNGRLVGFGGGLHIKKHLLELEQQCR